MDDDDLPDIDHFLTLRVEIPQIHSLEEEEDEEEEEEEIVEKKAKVRELSYDSGSDLEELPSLQEFIKPIGKFSFLICFGSLEDKY